MRQVRQGLRLSGLAFACCLTLGCSDALFAVEDCQVTHRDFEWEGNSRVDIVSAVREIVAAESFVDVANGFSPVRLFRTKDRVDAIWVFEASRRFEEVDCSGGLKLEYQWEFAIVQRVWCSTCSSSCFVYRKSLFSEGDRPDPFTEISPLDGVLQCEDFDVSQ